MNLRRGDYAVIASEEYLRLYDLCKSYMTDTIRILANKVAKIVNIDRDEHTADVEILNAQGTITLPEEALGNVLDVFSDDDMVRLIPDEDMMRSVLNRQCDGIFIPNQMIEQLGGQIVQITHPSETAFMVEINDHTWVVPWRYIDRKPHNSELSAFSDEELDKILII